MGFNLVPEESSEPFGRRTFVEPVAMVNGHWTTVERLVDKTKGWRQIFLDRDRRGPNNYKRFNRWWDNIIVSSYKFSMRSIKLVGPPVERFHEHIDFSPKQITFRPAVECSIGGEPSSPSGICPNASFSAICHCRETGGVCHRWNIVPDGTVKATGEDWISLPGGERINFAPVGEVMDFTDESHAWICGRRYNTTFNGMSEPVDAGGKKVKILRVDHGSPHYFAEVWVQIL